MDDSRYFVLGTRLSQVRIMALGTRHIYVAIYHDNAFVVSGVCRVFYWRQGILCVGGNITILADA